MTNKKSILLSVVAVAIFIGAISTASYAFFTTYVQTNNENNNNIQRITSKNT